MYTIRWQISIDLPLNFTPPLQSKSYFFHCAHENLHKVKYLDRELSEWVIRQCSAQDWLFPLLHQLLSFELPSVLLTFGAWYLFLCSGGLSLPCRVLSSILGLDSSGARSTLPAPTPSAYCENQVSRRFLRAKSPLVENH